MKPTSIYKLIQKDSGKRRFLVVVSSNLTGHRVQYLTSLIKRFSTSEVKIVLVLVSKIEFDLSVPQIRDLKALEFDYIDDCKKSRNALSVARKLAIENSKSEILFWDADNWILSLILFRQKSKLLFMRPYLSQKSVSKVLLLLIKWFAIIFFRYIRGFGVGILGVPLHPQRLVPSLWVDDALLVVPEFDTSESGKNVSSVIAHIPTSSKVVLVPGFITFRKNPQLVINAVELASELISTEITLIFAGKSDAECSTLIASFDRPNIRHINNYLSDDEYRMLLLRANVVVLPYTNRGSSGITIESLANGKPVILGDSNLWTEAALSSKGLLHLCKLEANAISITLSQVLNDDKPYAPFHLVGTKRLTVVDFFQLPNNQRSKK